MGNGWQVSLQKETGHQASMGHTPDLLDDCGTIGLIWTDEDRNERNGQQEGQDDDEGCERQLHYRTSNGSHDIIKMILRSSCFILQFRGITKNKTKCNYDHVTKRLFH